MRRCPRKKMCIVLLVLFIALMYAIIHIWANLKSCSNKEAQKIIMKLCLLYTSKKLDGNMCSEICQSPLFSYLSCHYRGNGKKVIIAVWNGTYVVLKSKYADFNDYTKVDAEIIDENGEHHKSLPDPELFQTMVYNEVNYSLQMRIPENKAELLNKMYTSAGSKAREEKKGNGQISNASPLTSAEMNSLWSLITQEEYVLLQYFKGFKYFPWVYGTCGHFYVVEYVPPGPLLNVAFPMYDSSFNPWEISANIALSMLDAVASLDTDFYSKLHFCDMKSNNFGVTSDLDVKIIDVDMLFSAAKMESLLYVGQPVCKQNEDCDFFDCLGRCNLQTKRCEKQRINNNLQTLCRDVLSSGFIHKGLLRKPPRAYRHQVNSGIRFCLGMSEAEMKKDDVTMTDAFKELTHALEISIRDKRRAALARKMRELTQQ